MNAAAGCGFADAQLVGSTVDVDVAGVRIHVTTTVEARFQSFQPENARGDFSVRQAFPGVADGPAAFENRSGRPAAADFFHNAMQSERRAI